MDIFVGTFSAQQHGNRTKQTADDKSTQTDQSDLTGNFKMACYSTPCCTGVERHPARPQTLHGKKCCPSSKSTKQCRTSTKRITITFTLNKSEIYI